MVADWGDEDYDEDYQGSYTDQYGVSPTTG